MIKISDELTICSEKLSIAVGPEKRNLIEKEINALEVEFFSIKHTMEKISLPPMVSK